MSILATVDPMPAEINGLLVSLILRMLYVRVSYPTEPNRSYSILTIARTFHLV